MLKIKIAQKPNINEALKKELQFKAETIKKYNKYYDDYYDDDDEDDYVYLSPYYPHNDSLTDESNEDVRMTEDKLIYFYTNIDCYDDFDNEPELFTTLKDFKAYCVATGITLSKFELENIAYRHTSYCTCDPEKKEKEAKLSIISEPSITGLYYDCASSNEDIILEENQVQKVKNT